MLRKTLLMAFVFTGFLTATSAYASRTGNPTIPAIHFAADNDERDGAIFQANAFVVHNTNTMKVFVIDPASKGTVIIFRNNTGRVIYKSGCINKQRFMGQFDLSQLPDGKYSMEIYAAAKFGLGKKQYKNKFEIQTQTKRNVSI